ncbi:acetyl-CoA C-acetyltransferase [Necator americanus]|uniref:Acetyl-CoA C-acetyltransferase n=1 Tax=Necator americanus TaxID=51031 RepID=W2TC57_NECAM|nr:acetyl-CoA C-acetyltransferase [Necator americanus]ETN79640.1 acetyl-CoA C-acetyltransferase [Necator americanus]
MASKSGVFIVGAKRTAFGTFGGKLKNHSATDLGVIATVAALKHANVKADDIDHVIFGNVVASSRDGIYLTRHIGLKSGVPQSVGALTQIKLGESKLVVAGGTENMTQVPFAVRNIRFGTALGMKYEFEDMLWESLSDTYAKLAMGQTAEKLGAQYKVSRKDADEFALRSQQLWKKAQDAGFYKAEIEPMAVKGRKGEETFDVDEHPRPGTTMESLTKLKPVFQKDGLINAGNASRSLLEGISDGAAAMVIAGEETLNEHSLKPLARVVSYAAVGCDPTIMGIGPVPAIRQVLAQTGLKIDDIDLFEVNEAFAPQALAVQRELGLPMEKLNLNGGAIALGHPLGASGARISVHLVHELKRRNLKYAIGSACIGGGQGIAILFENVQ